MGQAKRRSTKKREFSWPRITFDKAALMQALSLGPLKFANIKAKWYVLPRFHRRALAVLVPLVVLVTLLPTRVPLPSQGDELVRRDLPLNLDNRPEPVRTVGERIEPESPSRSVIRPLPNLEEPEVISQATVPAETPVTKPVAKPWQRYEVKRGETLANIFRDKSLPLSDLYAVAAIEGNDKPLSQIKAGQWLRYRQTTDGSLDALQIEQLDGEPIMFFRRSDGSFVRSQR
ncbi:LysM-like peptidoglycan-binding domain-containing protein [Photobacterium nomapromontoriensis]|uniref:LysM-like peptidoglycan-binding domain-containing protein n=1 Tax=Photobacterium nomapromontoriensis TaxID=2910237 RepID=UPI003D1075FA